MRLTFAHLLLNVRSGLGRKWKESSSVGSFYKARSINELLPKEHIPNTVPIDAKPCHKSLSATLCVCVVRE